MFTALDKANPDTGNTYGYSKLYDNIVQYFPPNLIMVFIVVYE
jgi:hypothetical protein